MQGKAAGILRTQIIFKEYKEGYITGCSNHDATVTVALPQNSAYRQLPALLSDGCKLNILSATTDEQGILHPRDIILEPDYLIDISSLARFIQPYGSPAMGYIINLFEKSIDSAARLLGEAANMFLDDCVNERSDKPATYGDSMKRFFREYPLQLSACNEIDNNFFTLAREQFNNIQIKVGTSGILDIESARRND